MASPPIPVVRDGVQPEMFPSPSQAPDLNTYESVVADIVAKLTEESKTRLREMRKVDLIRFHLSWGMDLRNKYQLWSNEALLQSCAAQRGWEGFIHPDTASGILMEGVWWRLRREAPRPSGVNESRATVEVPSDHLGGTPYSIMILPERVNVLLTPGESLEVVATSVGCVPWIDVLRSKTGALVICKQADHCAVSRNGEQIDAGW